MDRKVSFEQNRVEADIFSEGSHVRTCRVCYGDDALAAEDWLHPCRCAGSMRYVHKECFMRWLQNAPVVQQSQCCTCRYVYQKCWVLKPISNWCLPSLHITKWEALEIFLDIYSTIKFIRGCIQTFEGKRSLWLQVAHFLFWKTFIATERRLAYYVALGRHLFSSIFNISVQNYYGSSEGLNSLKDESA